LKKLKDVHHYEISAKTGEGVNELFYNIIDLIGYRLNNIKIIDQIDEKE
jgi:translation initiation factor IF-2